MNEKEAELIGMHIGDGTLYKTNSGGIVWEQRGSIYEKEYYAHVARLIKDTLGIEVKPKYRGPNSYGIQTTNKTITKFFLDRGFKPGSKVYTVRVPDYFKSADLFVKRAFVRGLFDTDGCIRFDKNRTPYHYYPRVEFSSASKFLMKDLLSLVNELGFNAYEWENKRKDGMEFKICISGFANLNKWEKEICPANSKHLNRIKEGLLNKSKVQLKKKSINL